MDLPSNPGQTARLHIYPDPQTGESIRSYKRQTHAILYRDHVGKFVLFSPPPAHLDTYTKPEPLPKDPTKEQIQAFADFVPQPIETPHANYMAQFASQLLPSFTKQIDGQAEDGTVIPGKTIRVPAVYQGLRLVPRSERRVMYREDRRRYKAARAKSRTETYDKGEITIDGQQI